MSEAPPQEDAVQRLSVVILTGAKGAGKSTVARRLVEHWGFYPVSFAARLREYAAALNPLIDVHSDDNQGLREPIYYNDAIAEVGYDDAKQFYPELRRFLQRLGTELFRDCVSETYWTDVVQEQLLADQPPLIVCDDCRFDNELATLMGLKQFGYGVAMVRVDRDLEADENDGHASEEAYRRWTPDAVIDNGGSLEALQQHADSLARSMSR